MEFAYDPSHPSTQRLCLARFRYLESPVDGEIT